MNQDSDRNDRRDGDRRSFGRRDDDRTNDRRNDDRRSDDRPRFSRSRPNDARDNQRSNERPQFSRDNDRRSDNQRNDFRRDDRRSDDRPRFDRADDRRSDNRRSDARPRPERSNNGDRPRFGRDDKRSDAQPRFDRRDNDAPRPERRSDDRPRFERSDSRRSDARRGDARPRFDRNDDRRSDDKRGSERPRFGSQRDEKPAFKRVGGYQRDADERNREATSRNVRRTDDRPRFGRNDDQRSNDRPRFSDRSDNQRNDARDGERTRFSDEQRKDSGDRRVGRYAKAPNYNPEQAPYKKRDNERSDNRFGGPKSRSYDDRKADRPARQHDDNPKRTAAQDGLTRLNRYIANSGVCSRREADELIERGDISVNGKVITELGFKVKEGDTVKYGTKVLNPEKFVYVLLNKPKDYITTTEDPEERRTVMELVAEAGNFRIYPVGRLDRNTTGLLLLTNDGELADKLTHPSNNVRKIYQVEIDKPITEEHFEAIQQGIELEDGPIKPDALSIVTPDAHVIGIEIHSGRNRIVRRMFEHLGYEVTKLDRTTFAGLTKKDLPRGKWRFLDPKEVVKLKYLN